MNILEVMQQARQMQEQIQKRMSDLRVEASAGGGMVIRKDGCVQTFLFHCRQANGTSAGGNEGHGLSRNVPFF